METQTFLFKTWYSRENKVSLKYPKKTIRLSKPKRWATTDRSLQELEVIQVLRQVPGCPYKFCAYGGKHHGEIDLNSKSLKIFRNCGKPSKEAPTQAPPTFGCRRR